MLSRITWIFLIINLITGGVELVDETDSDRLISTDMSLKGLSVKDANCHLEMGSVLTGLYCDVSLKLYIYRTHDFEIDKAPEVTMKLEHKLGYIRESLGKIFFHYEGPQTVFYIYKIRHGLIVKDFRQIQEY